MVTMRIAAAVDHVVANAVVVDALAPMLVPERIVIRKALSVRVVTRTILIMTETVIDQKDRPVKAAESVGEQAVIGTTVLATNRSGFQLIVIVAVIVIASVGLHLESVARDVTGIERRAPRTIQIAAPRAVAVAKASRRGKMPLAV